MNGWTAKQGEAVTMKTTKQLWMNRLAIGATVVALPLAVMAHGPVWSEAPEACAPAAPLQGGPMMLPPGMFPDASSSFMPLPPFLHEIELTETQQDKLFELMLVQVPTVRVKIKEAFKAIDELCNLAASDHFDAVKARALAETHAKALAQLALMHAELDAKVRALLTPEQRKLVDDARAKVESRHVFFKRS